MTINRYLVYDTVYDTVYDMIQLTWVWRMSGLMRDGTAKPVSRDQILRRERGQGNIHFPCSADLEQDWQSNLLIVDPYSANKVTTK